MGSIPGRSIDLIPSYKLLPGVVNMPNVLFEFMGKSTKELSKLWLKQMVGDLPADTPLTGANQIAHASLRHICSPESVHSSSS